MRRKTFTRAEKKSYKISNRVLSVDFRVTPAMRQKVGDLAQLRQLTAKKALSALFKRFLTKSWHYILTIGEGSRSLVGRVNPRRPSRAS